MSATSIIEKITRLRNTRMQETITSYRDLMVRIARGEELDPDEFEHRMADAARTLDDLQSDIKKHRHRLKLKAAVDAILRLNAECKALEKKIPAADHALKLAEKTPDGTTEPLYWRRKEVDRALSEASMAIGDFISTYEDPNLSRAINDLNTEDHQLSELRFQLNHRESQARANANREQVKAEQQLLKSDANSHREKAERFEREASVLERELKKLDRDRAEIAQRREEIEARMREVRSPGGMLLIGYIGHQRVSGICSLKI